MIITDGTHYIENVKELINEYYSELGRDLSFQDIAAELEDPMKKYSPPYGELLVALDGEKVIGMVAYKRLSDEACEMKRLFVRPGFRSSGVGLALSSRLIADAATMGYSEMVLDTITPLRAAIALYQRLGFVEREAYYHNPMPDVIYMKKNLVKETK